MKKLSLCVLALLLCACQPAMPNELPNEGDSGDVSTETDLKPVIIMPEIESFTKDIGVMKLNGDAVSNNQKAAIIEWLKSLELTPTHDYDEQLIISENDVSTSSDKTLKTLIDIEYGDQGFAVYDAFLSSNIYFLNFKGSVNIYPVDYFKLQEHPAFIRDKSLDISSLGTAYQPDFTIPADARVSKQFLAENRSEITIDLPYLSLGIWESVSFSKEQPERNIQQLMLAFYADQQGFFEKMQYVFTLVEPIAVGSYAMDDIDEIVIDGQLIKLETPIPDYSEFYKGEAVRQKYEELYGVPLGMIENDNSPWLGYTYEAEYDLFTYHEYRDGAVGGYTYDTPYAYDVKLSGNEMILRVASINTSFDYDKETVNCYKNSGLPIADRHFSAAAKADGILSVKELINEQGNYFDKFEIHGKLNPWGSYSLSKVEDKTLITMPEKDVIFYNNFERIDHNTIFMPLFDCNLARSANTTMLYDMNRDLKACNRYTFYEDERYAVVYTAAKVTKNKDELLVYLLDKQNKTFNQPMSQSEADFYYQQLKDANPHLKPDTEMILYEENGQSLLYLKGTDTTLDIVIKLKKSIN